MTRRRAVHCTLLALALALLFVANALGAPAPEWDGDFSTGPNSVVAGTPEAQYAGEQSCPSPCAGGGVTWSDIRVVTSPRRGDSYAAKVQIDDDGDTSVNPVKAGGERVELWLRAETLAIGHGDTTRFQASYFFDEWKDHPGSAFCILMQMHPTDEDDLYSQPPQAIRCNRSTFTLSLRGSGHFPNQECTIGTGVPPLRQWIELSVHTEWRADASGYMRASFRSADGTWGTSCELHGRNILTTTDLLYPKWGYYRATSWEHDATLYMDEVCQFDINQRTSCSLDVARPPAADACPPDVRLELSNVPSFLPWGSRRAIHVEAPAGVDATFESQTVARADGEAFARDDRPFDFSIAAARGEPAPSFVVSWTASYVGDDGVEHVCEGSSGLRRVRTGLDRRIVMNRSIAGVALAETRARVRDALGPPPQTRRRFDGMIRVWRYPGRRVGVWFYRSPGGIWRVHSVYTRSSTFRTPKDAGVGTTLTALRRKHPAVRCYSTEGSTECWIRRLAPLGSTILSLRDRRVYEVKVTSIGD